MFSSDGAYHSHQTSLEHYNYTHGKETRKKTTVRLLVWRRRRPHLKDGIDPRGKLSMKSVGRERDGCNLSADSERG